MKTPLVIAMLVLVGCGREGTAPLNQWDKIVTDCGPGAQCPIYIKDGVAYIHDSDGSFKPLAGP